MLTLLVATCPGKIANKPSNPMQTSDSNSISIQVKDLNRHLGCLLCNGYFRDARTITGSYINFNVFFNGSLKHSLS